MFVNNIYRFDHFRSAVQRKVTLTHTIFSKTEDDFSRQILIRMIPSYLSNISYGRTSTSRWQIKSIETLVLIGTKYPNSLNFIQIISHVLSWKLSLCRGVDLCAFPNENGGTPGHSLERCQTKTGKWVKFSLVWEGSQLIRRSGRTQGWTFLEAKSSQYRRYQQVRKRH